MPRRGEIYWVNAKDLDIQGHEQDTSRPYVIVSRDQINQAQHNVVGVPLSTKIHKACSYRILIQVAHMIPNPNCPRKLQDSVALVDHIRVLDVIRLEQPVMGDLSQTAVGALELALSFVFQII